MTQQTNKTPYYGSAAMHRKGGIRALCLGVITFVILGTGEAAIIAISWRDLHELQQHGYPGWGWGWIVVIAIGLVWVLMAILVGRAAYKVETWPHPPLSPPPSTHGSAHSATDTAEEQRSQQDWGERQKRQQDEWRRQHEWHPLREVPNDWRHHTDWRHAWQRQEWQRQTSWPSSQDKRRS
jgi:hypothetical protein